jgi:hypothetical protein
MADMKLSSVQNQISNGKDGKNLEYGGEMKEKEWDIRYLAFLG